MIANGPRDLPTIGFLTVIQHEELGLIGGYLLLNSAARPLEFHCTAPVKPNRAQEILYGPTLTPFLYGDRIGAALLEKGDVAPLLVCTDVLPALAVRDHVDFPVAYVGSEVVQADQHRFPFGPIQMAVRAEYSQDRRAIHDAWHAYADGFDLLEPFERIREAIGEAHQAAAG